MREPHPETEHFLKPDSGQLSPNRSERLDQDFTPQIAEPDRQHKTKNDYKLQSHTYTPDEFVEDLLRYDEDDQHYGTNTEEEEKQLENLLKQASLSKLASLNDKNEWLKVDYLDLPVDERSFYVLEEIVQGLRNLKNMIPTDISLKIEDNEIDIGKLDTIDELEFYEERLDKKVSKFKKDVFSSGFIDLDELLILLDSFDRYQDNIKIIIYKGGMIDPETSGIIATAFGGGMYHIEKNSDYINNVDNITVITKKIESDEDYDKFNNMIKLLDVYHSFGGKMFMSFKIRFTKYRLALTNIYFSDFFNNINLTLDLLKFYNRKDFHGVLMIGIRNSEKEKISSLSYILENLQKEKIIEFVEKTVISNLSDSVIRRIFLIGIKIPEVLDYISMELSVGLVNDFEVPLEKIKDKIKV